MQPMRSFIPPLAEGQFTVKRLDFKVGEGVWADTDTVANEVSVRLRMVLPM